MITVIHMDPANRMVRIGFDKHDGRWFARVDLWCVGFRLTNLAR